MKLKNKILIMFFAMLILIGISNVAFAGTQRLNSLEYEVQLNPDGSADVVETWDIYISETNTLFKDFNLDSSKYSGITDVKVKRVDSGLELTDINEEMYHVTKDCYYALPISGGKFEIAWGVGLDNSSANRTYQISYTIQDAVTVYNDCSEFYWQFIGIDNGVPANKVTGIIILPKEVSKKEKLRVWAHGPLNGEIKKASKNSATFKVDNFKPSTMLETRIVVEDSIFPESTKKVRRNKLSEILAEESKWADEANAKRRNARLTMFVIAIAYIAILIFIAGKIRRYMKQIKELSTNQNAIDIGNYFRDIPREKESTPAEAAFLYFAKNNIFSIDRHKSKVFAATILQLCLKGFITFETEDKKNIKINFVSTSQEKVEQLKPSEKEILSLLKRCTKRTEAYVTMEQIKSYAKTNYEIFGGVLSRLEKKALESHIDLGNYNKKNKDKVVECTTKMGGYMVALVVIFMIAANLVEPMLAVKTLLPLTIEIIICVILLNIISKKIKVLTDEGEIERQQWKGLKKYMEDFSMLDQREIPDLVLWEKYLVYATAFGISDKVIKQLKVVYPEMQELNDNRYTYMYLMSNSNFGDNFINSFNDGINKAYSAYSSAYAAAHSSDSSGSGGGGGFSSGGGGRRWRRPEWAVDKAL